MIEFNFGTNCYDKEPDFIWPQGQLIVGEAKIKSLELWASTNLNNSLTAFKLGLTDSRQSE